MSVISSLITLALVWGSIGTEVYVIMLEMTEVFKTRGRICTDYVRFCIPPVHCVEGLEHNVASAVAGISDGVISDGVISDGVISDGAISDGDFVGLPCAVILHQEQALVQRRH